EDGQRRFPRLSRGRDHLFRDGRGRQRQKDRDSAPRFVGNKRRTADGQISNGLAEIRQKSGDHRAACHRTLHTRGNARAVSRSFLQILRSLVKRRAPATNGRPSLTSCGRPSRAHCYADAAALFLTSSRDGCERTFLARAFERREDRTTGSHRRSRRGPILDSLGLPSQSYCGTAMTRNSRWMLCPGETFTSTPELRRGVMKSGFIQAPTSSRRESAYAE